MPMPISNYTLRNMFAIEKPDVCIKSSIAIWWGRIMRRTCSSWRAINKKWSPQTFHAWYTDSSSTNGSVEVMSDKKSSGATLSPMDIENQNGDANNEDMNSVHDISKGQENSVQNTEKMIDGSLEEEFWKQAGGDDEASKTKSGNDEIVDGEDTESVR